MLKTTVRQDLKQCTCCPPREDLWNGRVLHVRNNGCHQFIVLVIKQCDLAIYVHVPLNFTCEELMNLTVIALFSHLDAACKYMYSLKLQFFC